MVVFGQKLFDSGKVVLLQQKWLYSGKVAVFRISGCNRAKVVVFGQKLLCSGKMVLFG